MTEGQSQQGGTLVGMPLCAAGVREGIQPLLWGQREGGVREAVCLGDLWYCGGFLALVVCA